LTNLARCLRACLLLGLVCPAVGAAPSGAEPPAQEPSAGASSRQSASQAFELGKAHWARGELSQALAEFERAYRLSPAYQVLYDIGAVNVKLEQWARARQAFELYLALGADQLSKDQIQEVRVHLDALNKRTATLTLILNVPGAEVQVDGTKLETTTISGLIVDTGEHVVRVSKPGFHPLEQVVQAADGENLHLVFPLASLVPEPVMPQEAAAGVPGPEVTALGGPGSTEPHVHDQGSLWVPWTITAVLATGWATTTALAIQARHDRNIIERPGTSAERIDAARRLHVALAVVSDVLLVSTLASTGVSAYLTWWPEPAPEPTAQNAARRSGSLSLSVSGHF
jgi:tetratricopeptide (TPR) repeat protein